MPKVIFLLLLKLSLCYVGTSVVADKHLSGFCSTSPLPFFFFLFSSHSPHLVVFSLSILYSVTVRSSWCEFIIPWYQMCTFNLNIPIFPSLLENISILHYHTVSQLLPLSLYPFENSLWLPQSLSYHSSSCLLTWLGTRILWNLNEIPQSAIRLSQWSLILIPPISLSLVLITLCC